MPVHQVGILPGSQKLFNRVVRLTLGLTKATAKADGSALQITGLRVVAKTHSSNVPGPATAEISVYNLTKAHRAALNTRGTPVLLEAGYSGSGLASLFYGNAFFTDHVRTGPDWISKIQLMDGGNPYRFNRFVQSWKKGISVASVATALASAIGQLASGTAAVLNGLPGQFQRGYSTQGSASAALTTLLSHTGYRWHMSDGQVVVIPANGNNPTAVVLTQTTGLVGSPEHGTPDAAMPFAVTTTTVKCLLEPRIKVWSRFGLQSEGIGTPGNPAFYTAFTVEHDIDSLGTTGSPWYTNIEATTGQIPLGGKK